MTQTQMFHEDIYDALKDIVRALGGIKKVAPELFPAKNGNAESYLKDCLNPDRRETLDPQELLLLIKWGRDIGCHSAINYICDTAGYKRPEIVVVEDQHAELMRQYIDAVRASKAVADRMEALHVEVPSFLLKRAG